MSENTNNAPVVPVVPVVPTAPVVPEALAPTVKPEAPATPTATAPLEVQTGNAALDTAINVVLKSVGATQADVDRLVAKALEFDNAALIDEVFARERFGDSANQVIELAKAAVAESVASIERTKQTVFQIAGGEENWQNAVSLFNHSAPDHLKEAAKFLLDSGKVQEGVRLIMDNVVNAGLVSQVNPTVASGPVVPSNSGALSAQGFSEAMSALKKEAGNRSLESGPFADKYNQLIQRRQLGRRAGI